MIGERLNRSVVSMCADRSGSAYGMGLQQVDTARINKRVSIPKCIGIKSEEVNSQRDYYTRTKKTSRTNLHINAHSHFYKRD